MKPSDMNRVENIIRTSGIGTVQQREAMIQRIKDAFEELKPKKEPK